MRKERIMPSKYMIRPVQNKDLAFLWAMLYEAAAVDATIRAMGQEKALSLPTIQKYLAGWGRDGDVGRIAVDEQDVPLGAAWYRLFPASAPGYGFVSATIPELTIGIHSSARGQGIGGALIQALLSAAAEQGWLALSLSVDRQNPAKQLYERYGFRDMGISQPADSSATLIRYLKPPISQDK
jgi:ribosomal protein S18 acetylase RimI-like enzyme